MALPMSPVLAITIGWDTEMCVPGAAQHEVAATPSPAASRGRVASRSEARWGIMANEIARTLRKRMTPQEFKSWVHLRAWRKQGFHFRRQAPRNGYIVDFVCLKIPAHHRGRWRSVNFDAHVRRDAQREGRLAREGFRVLRFWNNEIDRNLEGDATASAVAVLRSASAMEYRATFFPARHRPSRACCRLS